MSGANDGTRRCWICSGQIGTRLVYCTFTPADTVCFLSLSLSGHAALVSSLKLSLHSSLDYSPLFQFLTSLISISISPISPQSLRLQLFNHLNFLSPNSPNCLNSRSHSHRSVYRKTKHASYSHRLSTVWSTVTGERSFIAIWSSRTFYWTATLQWKWLISGCQTRWKEARKWALLVVLQRILLPNRWALCFLRYLVIHCENREQH